MGPLLDVNSRSDIDSDRVRLPRCLYSKLCNTSAIADLWPANEGASASEIRLCSCTPIISSVTR